MSVLGNAKSNRHRKTYQVESGDAGRKSWHLTRGDLPSESLGGVSRSRSSEEARSCSIRFDVATAATIESGEGQGSRWIPVWSHSWNSELRRKRRQEEKALNEG